MGVIGGFRSNLSITRKTDGNLGNVSEGVLFSNVAYQRKRGKTTTKIDLMYSQDMWKLNFMLDFNTFRMSKGISPLVLKTPLSIETTVRCRVFAVCG